MFVVITNESCGGLMDFVPEENLSLLSVPPLVYLENHEIVEKVNINYIRHCSTLNVSSL